MGEFDLIERYFSRPSKRAALGVGDDCALLAIRPGHELAISTDMLVCGRHFLSDVAPAALGWKSLAVNLSDLAAMGAEPMAFTLALALPAADEDWLEAFSDGLYDCAARYACELVGGDTTSGPLNICIAVYGEVPLRTAVRRAGAKVGDDIWVSGELGSAALGLRVRQGAVVLPDEAHQQAINALERPIPRLALGRDLRGIATAMIDISDGLASDLGHILAASRVAGRVSVDAVPQSQFLSRQPEALRLYCLLAGGDDYELCFTAPPDLQEAVQHAGREAGVALARIGMIEAGRGLEFENSGGTPYRFPTGTNLGGFDHFG